MKISAQISILIYFPPCFFFFFFFPTHPCCFLSYPSNQTTGLKKKPSPKKKSIRFADLKEVHLNDAQDPVLGRLRTQLGIMKWAKQSFGLERRGKVVVFFCFLRLKKPSPLFSGEEKHLGMAEFLMFIFFFGWYSWGVTKWSRIFFWELTRLEVNFRTFHASMLHIPGFVACLHVFFGGGKVRGGVAEITFAPPKRLGWTWIPKSPVVKLKFFRGTTPEIVTTTEFIGHFVVFQAVKHLGKFRCSTAWHWW